ncbi:hypothetical protein R3P38DRAFT_2572323, partial [Favolaschia claudopus]
LGRYLFSRPTKVHALGLIKSRIWWFPAPTLISICHQYGAKIFFEQAFRWLVPADLRQLSSAQVDMIGVGTYVTLARLKGAIAQHRAIILAAEEPQFDKYGAVGPRHCPVCWNNEACAEDWHSAWWNSVGRALLDGRTPQTWTAALKVLASMHCGRMHLGCRQKMVEHIQGHEGNGVLSEMIDKVSRCLCNGRHCGV